MKKLSKQVFSVLIVIAVILGSGLLLGGQPASADNGQVLILEKIDLPEKGNPNLDTPLNMLVSAETTEESCRLAEENEIYVGDDTVRVIVECVPGELESASIAVGEYADVEMSYADMLQVLAPISQLKSLADIPGVRMVRIPYQPVYNDLIVSEGVPVISADDWHTAGYDGSGVKVGVVDGGFSGYPTHQAEGELPPPIATHWAPSVGGPGSSIHGTACAEVAYDVAPGSQFYLANYGTVVEFGDAVDWMISQGVDVISCSMGNFLGGPGNGTGDYCDAVANARANGILWAQAIGNHSLRHWQGNFNDTDADWAHEFDGADISNAIWVTEGYTIVAQLKWNDTWGSSGNDYDLYLCDGVGAIIWSSTDTQDGDDNPVEGFSCTAPYTGYHHLVIVGYESPAVRNLHLYSFYHDLQYQTPSSSFGVPADSPDALTVGAVNYATPSTLEDFSSQGPTDDGRTKPDLVAPDGVSTATYGPVGFPGTSASAPHVAGAAALVCQQYPSYTPAQVQSFLESRAVELGAPGKDNLYGSGRLDLGACDTPPTLGTRSATSVASTSARLRGALKDLGSASSVDVSFEWGKTTSYGHETPAKARDATGGFSRNLKNLSPGTTYHYRAKGVGDGTGHGPDRTFTTTGTPPTIGTRAARNVTSNSAKLVGALKNLGTASSVGVSFEWGLTTAYGNETPTRVKSATGGFSRKITGLLPGTTYHYRAKGVGDGTGYGPDRTFTTPP